MGEEHRVMHKNLSKFPWRANGPNGPHGNEINLELKWPIIWISLLRFTSFVSITDLRLINTAMMPLKVGIYFEQIFRHSTESQSSLGRLRKVLTFADE